MPPTRRLLDRLEFGECRDLNHAWRTTLMRPQGTLMWRHCECLHECGTWKEEIISMLTGTIEHRKMHYEKGYVQDYRKQKGPRPTKADFRREYFSELQHQGRTTKGRADAIPDNVRDITARMRKGWPRKSSKKRRTG